MKFDLNHGNRTKYKPSKPVILLSLENSDAGPISEGRPFYNTHHRVIEKTVSSMEDCPKPPLYLIAGCEGGTLGS